MLLRRVGRAGLAAGDDTRWACNPDVKIPAVIESRVRGAVALPLASLCASIVAVVFTVSFLVSGPVHRIPPGFALAAWSAWAIVMVLRRRLTAPVGNRSRLLSALVALVAVWAGLYA